MTAPGRTGAIRWRLLIFVAVAASFAFAGTAAAQTPDIVIGLGDSYASGEGSRARNAPDWDRATGGKDGCHRGPNAWPRKLGVISGWHLACTGAVIDDVIKRGQKRRRPDNVSQLSRLAELDAKLEIDAVLLTIGGNDMDFAGKITACVTGHKCLRDLDKLDREFAALKPRLVDAYGQIADATWGDLIVVGYPDIFPDRDEADQFYKCGWLGETRKHGTAEKTGVWHMQDALERTIREAAEEADVDFISIRDALDGHEMCTRDSAVNKLTLTGKDRAHPKAFGQQLMADAVRRGLNDLYAEIASAGAAAAAPWRDCGDVGFEQNSDFGAFDVQAKRVRCRKAWRVAAGSKEMNVVSGPFTYRIGGFRCKGTPTDEALPSVRWVCRRKQARVRFTRA
jgi:lysophospholipase L1-like esterase